MFIFKLIIFLFIALYIQFMFCVGLMLYCLILSDSFAYMFNASPCYLFNIFHMQLKHICLDILNKSVSF